MASTFVREPEEQEAAVGQLFATNIFKVCMLGVVAFIGATLYTILG